VKFKDVAGLHEVKR